MPDSVQGKHSNPNVANAFAEHDGGTGKVLLKDSAKRALVQRLSEQIFTNDRILTETNANKANPLVYVAGFNVVGPSEYSSNLPFVRMLPWYLILIN